MSYTLTVWWPGKEGAWEMHGHFIARAEEIAARVTLGITEKTHPFGACGVQDSTFGQEHPTATSGRGCPLYSSLQGFYYSSYMGHYRNTLTSKHLNSNVKTILRLHIVIEKSLSLNVHI